MGSETLVVDRIASPAKKRKALNSASVALRAGTQVSGSASIVLAYFHRLFNGIREMLGNPSVAFLAVGTRRVITLYNRG